VRVALPLHLRNLARVPGDVMVEVPGEPTPRAILDALELRYPVLRGTIRDQATQRRRDFIRFFACGEDVTHEGVDARLSDDLADGRETFHVVGAIAGG
jgi:hypothetical protein